MEGAQAVSINTSETWCKQTAIGTENSKEVHQKIRVLNFHAKIDKQATSIDESSASVLKYRTPNFRYWKRGIYARRLRIVISKGLPNQKSNFTNKQYL